MDESMTRRGLLGAAAAAAAAGTAVTAADAEAAQAKPGGKVRILGLCCSPRVGKTTSAGLAVALEAAKKVDPKIEVELIELGGMDIPVFDPTAKDKKGDFPKLAPRISEPHVRGIIVGSPVYFGNMSSLCKAMLDHWMVFRKGFALADRVGGALAVGGCRNGGQELVLQSILAAMMGQNMVLVGDDQPTSHFGATLVNTDDSIAADAFGRQTAANLGWRVAKVALALAGGK